MEIKVEPCSTALATAQPLAAEIEELSTLVKQLADSVAAHEVGHCADGADAAPATPPPAPRGPTPVCRAADPAVRRCAAPTPAAWRRAAAGSPDTESRPSPASTAPASSPRIGRAIDGGGIDLYLQPIVTLPQRKVRYYEALSRLKADNGDMVAAADFLEYAEAGG